LLTGLCTQKRRGFIDDSFLIEDSAAVADMRKPSLRIDENAITVCQVEGVKFTHSSFRVPRYSYEEVKMEKGDLMDW